MLIDDAQEIAKLKDFKGISTECWQGAEPSSRASEPSANTARRTRQLDFILLPVYSMPDLTWPYGKQGKHVARFISRRSGDDDSRIAASTASPRVRIGPAHSATLEPPASGRRGVPVSGPPAAAESEASQSGVDHLVVNQPARARLRDHENRLASSRAGGLAFRTHVGRRSDGTRAREKRPESLGGRLDELVGTNLSTPPSP